MLKYIAFLCCFVLIGCRQDLVRADLSKPIEIAIDNSSKSQSLAQEYIIASMNEWNLKAQNRIKWKIVDTINKCNGNTLTINFVNEIPDQDKSIIGLYTNKYSCPYIFILDKSKSSGYFYFIDMMLGKDRRYITLMHELGHYFGLPHSESHNSIMTHDINGSKISPTCQDINNLRDKFPFIPACK